MHADMEIHSAAKLPTRHLRRAAGTGARSSLKSELDLSSVCWLSVRSASIGFMNLNHLVARRSYSFRVVLRDVGNRREERSENSTDFTSGKPETTSVIRGP